MDIPHLFIHLSDFSHLHFLATIRNAGTTNIYIHVLWASMLSFLLDINLGVELLGCMVTVYLIF
jgi:hypothetical protein